MDNGTQFLIILLTASISTIIDFVSAICMDNEHKNNQSTTAVAIGLVFKVMILLFIVLPILGSGVKK